VAEVAPRSPADLAGFVAAICWSASAAMTSATREVPALVFSRDCAPVSVVFRRGDARFEKTITPVDQASLYEQACSEGDPAACFRVAWLNDASYEDA
jgi:S1-C subfamily serine protease